MDTNDKIYEITDIMAKQFELRCLGLAASNGRHAISGTRRQVRRRMSKLRLHEIHRDGWMATDDRMLKDTHPFVVKTRKALPIGWRP